MAQPEGNTMTDHFIPGGKSSMAKYSRGAQKAVKGAMHKKKRGKLKSGRSGKRVKSRKQAIAIGLSEARKKGAKVPPPKKGTKKKTKKKASRKKGPARKKAPANRSKRSKTKR
jgi:hypothetical protein